MANVLKREKQIQVLHLLVEGNSLRSIERLTGVQKKTAARLMVRFADACQRLMDRELTGLELGHVEIDEMWTFVQKKQGKVKAEEKRFRYDIGDQYLWYGIDLETKLVPCHLVGKRTANNARRLMVDLRNRLVLPKPHEADRHAYKDGEYKQIIQISTDALAAYPEAVDLAFGPYVRYGQIVKNYRNADQPGRYAPPEMIEAERRAIRNIENLWSICTSHIERANLTVRTFLKRFTRLALGFSKKLENLQAATTVFFAYYNFCWRSRYADDSGQRGRLRPTAAMMAGVVNELWDIERLYDEAMADGRLACCF